MTLNTVVAKVAVTSIQIFTHLFDLVTLPIYILAYQPWKYYLDNNRCRADTIQKDDTSLTVYSKPFSCKIREKILSDFPHIDTINNLMNHAINVHGSKQCLGTRPILSIDTVQNNDGRLLTKHELADYKWLSYNDVNEQIQSFAHGLRYLGFQPREKIVIYAETSAKWLISALGCFRNAYTLVTVYTNLGEDGVAYSLNQTDAKVVITSEDLLPKLKGILKKGGHIHTIIYIEKPLEKMNIHAQNDDGSEQASEVNVYSFTEVIRIGVSSYSPDLDCYESWKATPEDIAIIMYTSGSTGNPKGALLSHANILSGILACCPYGCNLLVPPEEDRYIAYLPLAHIFEFTLEMTMILRGTSIGYSGPNTLTDAGTMIKRGHMGDARALKPTSMIAVPVILDRIFKGIQFKVSQEGAFKENLFTFCYQYRSMWRKLGFDTPIMNKLIFKKVRESLGGEIQSIIGGGAPLSPEVHDFLETVLCVKISQGYGLTESCGGITLCHYDDYHVGEVGYPLPGAYIKLVNWEEGGYKVNNSTAPRGEIHVGGNVVAMGYYNMSEKTKESFYEKDGIRWFPTGDIGQLQPTGAFKIIDRKKDLVKLQMGEYVSLGKVEGAWKIHPFVDAICSYGNSFKFDIVAVVVPDKYKFLNHLKNNHAEEDLNRDFSTICSDPEIVKIFLKTLQVYSAKKLEKFEIPKRILLEPEPWTPDCGLVTAALKLKRRTIQEKYQEDIDRMYTQLDEERHVKSMASFPSGK
ncbi:long-chain-fatty-acid--CoA ligase 4 [Lepeophtheirus salmonis]|uniref:long-chain-fatty-acid--CoA ligase 4 n=1 Tax=Lepeophtheirus salmonis TaxID=72036 RepID=UPI001AE60ABD|nr:long-chain-fatty-acid--CoA ligase 4-like [Lepeophtheirus salmonis]XP_040580498.1 long-chain-fatty-acid--CoA ligase 4-like [Lepeophtheirus salmonis]